MSKRLLGSLLVGLFFAASPTYAYAYFKVTQTHVEPPTHTSPLKDPEVKPEVMVPAKSFSGTRVIQVGNAPVVKKTVSKGTGLPLEMALEMLLPSSGWILHKEVKNQNLLKQELTWEHHGTWLEGLEEIGQAHSLDFLVNWTTLTVYVRDSVTIEQPVQPVVASQSVLHQGDLTEEGEPLMSVVEDRINQLKTEVAAVDVVATEVLPLVVKEAKPQESILPGNLEESLDGYIKKHDHELAWDMDPGFVYSIRYPIVLPAGGPFLQNLKFIENSLNQQGFNFRFEAYNNAVVRVTEKK